MTPLSPCALALFSSKMDGQSPEVFVADECPFCVSNAVYPNASTVPGRF
jgi:hypothetical protein